ncbi:MAG: hypothetical protein WDZ69_03080 [Candidatus Pacearchaeota archaeon]
MLIDRKGFLLAEETLKMILSVIAIGFLAFLLFSLYNAGKSSQDLEFAEESVDFLLEGINAEVEDVEIFNPEGWVVVSWPYEGMVPDACSNVGWENCICIVEDAGEWRDSVPLADGRIEKLKGNSNEGACRENPSDFSTNGPIKIRDAPIVLEIDYENEVIRRENES